MKTVIITLLLTAASVMSCKPPMPPTDNESACTSSCKQDQRTADVIGEADIITGIASDDFPSLFIQGNHFQFQRKNGLYAPLGIGFMEVIAEQNPVIPLYRTATCKEPEDSIALHQYPFDKDIAERKRKDDNPQEWQDVMQVNVNATFMLTQALLPLLLKSDAGSLVFTSSSVGRQGRANWGAYAASKFATEGMMQVLADEYQQRLRVNCINPGGTRTAMRASAFPTEDPQKLKTPADIMPLYLWLMGDDSRRKTGMTFDAQPGRKPGISQ